MNGGHGVAGRQVFHARRVRGNGGLLAGRARRPAIQQMVLRSRAIAPGRLAGRGLGQRGAGTGANARTIRPLARARRSRAEIFMMTGA